MDINYYAKANRDLTKSLRINSKNTFAYFYRGASFLLLGKYDNAIEDFSSALELDDMDFDAYLGLALTYLKMNDLDKAKVQLKKAKDILGTEKYPELYENTYWYESQYYFFTNNIKALETTSQN
jgi:tetratricopeptide (TPR) repeat protein